ncbi:MBL fold metallo-hydrolase [Desulfuromonas versatilis]|uniref:MBL fold metallo-hydrolase n=1 Tax=Desulfuromonas versatilis TaxID=2802975 RepID=A0ABM8HSZ5_9BACT|nr:FprA family A-type flavoprotein [Desulfuromonas versatilis]BCR06116.1 MBL fold metallo-hydrolase [Desulfuromonas versatilis]
MAGPIEIKPGVTWLGARHPELRIFDELFPTRHGSSYNSYLVRGTSKTALIDTVKAPYTEAFIENLSSLVPLEQIDLVVVNHTEPDHSGALGRLLELNPEIEVYCTRPGENFLKQLFEQPMKTHPVAEGEEIDLGGRTLRFILAPSLHWPDTMFTYLVEDAILFSCDAFGSHYCSDKLYNDEAGDFTAEFEQYFDTIMRPFKEKIREAVAKVEGLPIELVCPSHGPVLRSHPKAAIARYKELAAAPPASAAKRALVLTLSPHGNTRQMARSVAAGLQAQGVEVAEYSLIDADTQVLRSELERCDALVVGTPTINRDAPPPVWNALSLLSSVTPKGKLGAVFGSFGWSGEAVNLVEERLKGLKYSLPVPGLTYRFKPTDHDIQECRDFGEQVGKALTQA